MERSVPRRSVGKDLFAEATAETGRSSTRNALDTMIDHLVQRKASLNLLFRQFDADGSGSIDLDELWNALRSVGLRLTREQAQHVMIELDADGDGTIDLVEFVEFFKRERAERWWGSKRKPAPFVRLRSPPKPPSTAAERMALAAVNRMVDHLVSRKTVLTKLFQDYDKDQSGTIDQEELKAALKDVGLRLSDAEVGMVMSYLDADGSGEIDLEEFTAAFKVERAKRFEGGVQELGPARVQLMARLSKVRDGEAKDATFAALQAVQRLQGTQDGMPEEEEDWLRQLLADLLNRGMSVTKDEARLLQLAARRCLARGSAPHLTNTMNKSYRDGRFESGYIRTTPALGLHPKDRSRRLPPPTASRQVTSKSRPWQTRAQVAERLPSINQLKAENTSDANEDAAPQIKRKSMSKMRASYQALKQGRAASELGFISQGDTLSSEYWPATAGSKPPRSADTSLPSGRDSYYEDNEYQTVVVPAAEDEAHQAFGKEIAGSADATRCDYYAGGGTGFLGHGGGGAVTREADEPLERLTGPLEPTLNPHDFEGSHLSIHLAPKTKDYGKSGKRDYKLRSTSGVTEPDQMAPSLMNSDVYRFVKFGVAATGRGWSSALRAAGEDTNAKWTSGRIDRGGTAIHGQVPAGIWIE